MVTRKKTTDADVKPQHGLKMRLDDMLTISPKTEKQKEFFDAYQQGHYFCALSGVAGTGKTYIAFYKALEEVMDRVTPTVSLLSSVVVCRVGRWVTYREMQKRR
jgi:phosphate starvation-inducible protein PhoH